jgi:hypothetical protein
MDRSAHPGWAVLATHIARGLQKPTAFRAVFQQVDGGACLTLLALSH